VLDVQLENAKQSSTEVSFSELIRVV
jgi:hypothetical protein